MDAVPKTACAPSHEAVPWDRHRLDQVSSQREETASAYR